jgi:hypothetical protein
VRPDWQSARLISYLLLDISDIQEFRLIAVICSQTSQFTILSAARLAEPGKLQYAILCNPGTYGELPGYGAATVFSFIRKASPMGLLTRILSVSYRHEPKAGGLCELLQ